MSDVVITLPLRDGEEASLFGRFLSRFIESCRDDAELWSDNDSPYVMVRSAPQADLDLKILTFQERHAAQAFSAGWAAASLRLRAAQASR